MLRYAWTIFIGTIFLFSALVAPYSVYAQVLGVEVARTLVVRDEGEVEGDIVSLTENPQEVVLTREVGDPKMYGVLMLDPVVVLRTNNEIPVVRGGEVFVNATTIAGPIVLGDFVTSSDIPGKAQKAADSKGYMLGTALSSLGEADGEEFQFEGKTYRRGQIRVLLNIRPISFTGGNIFSTLQQAQAASLDIINDSRQRDKIIRYIIALIIVALTVYFGYRMFGKSVTKGIEGIGRNPLAKVSIQTMIVFNMILIGVVCLGGMVLALLVISL